MCTYIPISPPSWASFPHSLSHPSTSSQAPSWSPCAMLLLPTSYFTFCSVYMLLPLSLHTSFPLPPQCPQVHSLCLCLYSCPATRFINTIFFFRLHIYALAYGICFSLSDLLHSVWQTVGPSTSLQITQFCFFLWLSNMKQWTKD